MLFYLRAFVAEIRQIAVLTPKINDEKSLHAKV
jgi:hypothetical protein